MVFGTKKEIVFVLLVAVLLFISACDNASETEMEDIEDDDQTEEDMETFTLTGSNFKFSMNGENNPDLVVEQGDRVRIEFTSEQGFHDFTLDEFDVATEQVSEGESTSIEFVADEKGTFEYYCSVGDHREKGMKGNFIVQ